MDKIGKGIRNIFMSHERPDGTGNDWDGKLPLEMNVSERLARKTGGWLTLPNAVSVAGLASAGLGLYMFTHGQHAEGTALFLTGRAADLVDGSLAKIMHLRGKTGAYLDAIIDKTTLAAALVTLTCTGDMPLIATTGALVTQAGIALENTRIHEAGGKATPNWRGKLATISLSGAVIIYMGATTVESMGQPVLGGVLRTVAHVAMGASIVSGAAAWFGYHKTATARTQPTKPPSSES